MKKELLTAGKNGETQKYFIMGNKGQIGTQYFDKLKDCMIAIFKMNTGTYTNIYDMSDKEYNVKILGKNQ